MEPAAVGEDVAIEQSQLSQASVEGMERCVAEEKEMEQMCVEEKPLKFTM